MAKPSAAVSGTIAGLRPHDRGPIRFPTRGRLMHGTARRLVALLGLTALAAVALARPDAPLAPFTLPDAAGKPWTLPDAQAAPVVVVVFTGTACPINNAYLPTLTKLHKDYGPKGVTLVAVNANAQDDAAAVAAHAKKYDLPFPVLKDAQQSVADRLGARFTPEAVVLDADRKVRYRGRIDDQFGFGYKRPAPTAHELTDAIDAVLAGKPVPMPATEVEGCAIARAAQPRADATVTYAQQVSRIL